MRRGPVLPLIVVWLMLGTASADEGAHTNTAPTPTGGTRFCCQ